MKIYYDVTPANVVMTNANSSEVIGIRGMTHCHQRMKRAITHAVYHNHSIQRVPSDCPSMIWKIILAYTDPLLNTNLHDDAWLFCLIDLLEYERCNYDTRRPCLSNINRRRKHYTDYEKEENTTSEETDEIIANVNEQTFRKYIMKRDRNILMKNYWSSIIEDWYMI